MIEALMLIYMMIAAGTYFAFMSRGMKCTKQARIMTALFMAIVWPFLIGFALIEVIEK